MMRTTWPLRTMWPLRTSGQGVIYKDINNYDFVSTYIFIPTFVHTIIRTFHASFGKHQFLTWPVRLWPLCPLCPHKTKKGGMR